MKAIVFEKYGSPEVLKLQEVDKPTLKDHDILIKVHAVAVGYGDILARSGMPLKDFNMPLPLFPIVKLAFGIRKPRTNILGGELSGIVEEIGDKVTKFKKGDKVFAYIGQSMHGNAEYIRINENKTVALMPSNMTFDEAGSTTYGSIMAYSLTQRMNLEPGKKILILGASGGIGHFTVQFAKLQGAEVTGVCSSSGIDLVKSLGADNVIDYTKEDFRHNGVKYDIIFDILHRYSYAKVKNSLTKDGKYILASFGLKNILHMYWRKLIGGKKVLCMIARESGDNLTTIKQLIEEGKIISKVDKNFPLEEASKAHEYIESGRKKGQVVLNVSSLSKTIT